ncbi:hypothetical protein Bca52824_096710 [Brassica carinata]|uniref:Uncharacterized protein n=1 Tax=Brassica carinata TaxID=52824 RepID=A0A8X7THJ1_BRACI|nr:hypothetical protein Bca52824_096710 [Brassica carinata]
MERGGSNLSDKGLNSVDRGSKATATYNTPPLHLSRPQRFYPPGGRADIGDQKQRRYERLAATSQLSLCSELAVRRPRNSRELFPPSPLADTLTSAAFAASSSAVRQQSTVRTGIFEPSPQSQSFSPVGSILSLSLPTLFHRMQAVHLGDLMRYEYDRGAHSSSDFRGRGMHRHHADAAVLFQPLTYLLSRFQGGHVKQKITLPNSRRLRLP